MFVTKTGAIVVKANWSDNPWFPEVLEKERLRCLERNPKDYDNDDLERITRRFTRPTGRTLRTAHCTRL